MSDEDRILKEISEKLKNAVSWSNSNIANKQEQALKYYRRSLLPGDDKLVGRSRWVSAEIQTRVDWLTASLIRIFDSPDNVCEFAPVSSEDDALAKQQTAVVNWILKTKNSHLSFLHPWIQNGLITSLGVVTAEFTEEVEEGLPKLLKGVPEQILPQLTAQEEAGEIIIERVGKPVLDPVQGTLRDISIREVRKTPKFSVFSLPPEDVIVSMDAKFDPETGGISAKIQGHRKYYCRQELIDMGFDREKVESIPSSSDKMSGIANERNKLTFDGRDNHAGSDVEVIVIYTKIKIDKKARHYRITLGGGTESYVYLDHEEVSRFYPYAAFVPFPQADSLLAGLGVADKIGDDHVLLSRMNRAILDSLQLSVNPTKIVNPDVTNLDDALSIHPGKVIRSTDPSGGISYNAPPFAGSNAIPVFQQMQQGLDFSTGVGASMIGLNPSDFQNTTATAVNQRSNSSQLIVEMVARIFAETGYRYLTKIIISQLTEKPELAQKFISRLTNSFVPIDQFEPELDVSTSVAFAVMSRDQSTQNLMNMLNQQLNLQGSGSPIVNPQNVYSTLTKLAEASGFKNTAAFFTDPSTVPPPPPAPAAPDPNAGLIEVEKVKAQLKAQSDDAQRQFDTIKLQAEMDLKRDQLAAEIELKRYEMELKYRQAVDVEKLKAEIAAPRDPLTGAIPARAIPTGVIEGGAL